MDGYPDTDEEFELMYGDELDAIREHEGKDDIGADVTPGPSVRKSLNFGEVNNKSKSIEDPSKSTRSIFSNSQTPIYDYSVASTSKEVIVFETNTPSTSENNPSALDDSFNRDFSIIEENESSHRRKRAVEDLFGDIDDIIAEDRLHKSKRIKQTLEEDFKLIEYIKQERQLKKTKLTISENEIAGNFRVTSKSKHLSENLSFRVPKYPFIVVVRHDGERVYVRMHSEEYEDEEIKRVAEQSTNEGFLMGKSFKLIIEKAKSYLQKRKDDKQKPKPDDDIEIVTDSDNAEMWVDMYKPRTYIELLSDESTNRTLLRWIKLWDKVVFKGRSRVVQKKGKKTAMNRFKKNELDETLDEYHRPIHKIALLCGPPGLGKTTLAHMVAKHAGYNVVEINASDDRNVDSFKTALESATQMKSVLDKERRPNCLVFDEIDGAPSGSIDFLIKFINGTVKPKKGKKQKAQILKRPIICICNDVYVPALRPLRQIAFVLNFPPTASARLAERLCEIARRQKITTDVGAMTTLSAKSDNDIRSCLSVLHFFKSQNKPVTLTEVHRHNVGNKDTNKGLFTVWQELFQVPKPPFDITAERKDIAIQLSENETYRTNYILNVVQSFGDYDRLAQGVFENFVEVTTGYDLPLIGAVEGLDWFCFSDVLSRSVYESQNWILAGYIPYSFVKWNTLFAVPGKPKITYPNRGIEAHSKSVRSTALIGEIMKGMLPLNRPYVTQNILRLEVLPFLSEIIVPVVKTVNVTLFGNCEKAQLAEMMNIMIAYCLTYVQERTVDGTYVFNLDPNIDEIVQFQSLKKQRRCLQYSVKQLIAREIELENVRRSEGTTRKGEEKVKDAEQSDQEDQVKEGKENKENEASNSGTVLPNHLQRLKAKNIQPAAKETIVRDFFGRIIQKSNTSKFGGKISSAPIQKVWFVYKEGYNNAVKRKLKIKQLM